MKLLKSMAIILVLAHASQTNASAEQHADVGDPKTMETLVYVAPQGQADHPHGYQDITVPIDRDRVRVTALAIKAALTQKFSRDFSPYSVLFQDDLIPDKSENRIEDSILAKDLKRRDSKIDYPTIFKMTPTIQRNYADAQRKKEQLRRANATLNFEILNGHIRQTNPSQYHKSFVDLVRQSNPNVVNRWPQIEEEHASSSSSSSSSSCASSSCSIVNPFAMTLRSMSSLSSSSSSASSSLSAGSSSSSSSVPMVTTFDDVE